MEKTKVGLGFISQTVPIGAHRFEQVEGTNDVGLNEIFRAMNAAVNMGFGRKINDGAWLVFG